MASETFLPTKYPFTHPLFSNDYLLKHGNFFTKPILHQDGYPLYPVMGESPGYRIYPDLKSENSDMPLNFVIKQEKPPTPSPSPTDVEAKDEQLLNGNSKNGTWISGKQKLSWDNSIVASYNPDTKMFRCVVCNAVGFLSRIAEHYLGTHTSAKVFQCLHCPYSSTWSRCVRMHMAKHHGVPNAPPSLWKGQPLLEEIFQLLTNLKTTVDSQGRERLDPELSDKKFVCPKCPYTTDRRDLFLRHENIHKEDKPYHCYICFKLFNRADHVKKHFLRIHRGHPYDISLVRRRPPRVQSSVNGNSNNHHSNGLSSFSVDKLIAISSNDAKSDNEVIDLSNHDASAGDTANSKQPKTFQCPYCSWEGVDSWCLRRHMNIHLKSFECPVCEFKAGKAERLFTHVYRAHKKLVCTKCKFTTDLAHDFEIHIKECCLEIIVGNAFDKTSEDSLNESDDGSLEIKINNLSEMPPSLPTVLPVDPLKMSSDRPASLDLKGSVSLMPLHNSISYCYQGTQRFNAEAVSGLNGFQDEMTVNVGQDIKQSLLGNNANCKAEVKPELASPVQSSSDSGVADVISDNNDQDFACWHCGCEFADQTSLLTHTDLYHREDLWKGKTSAAKKTKKFSCAICNFNSDRQRTIIEHMRFHTGEVLACRAGPPCAFSTVSDSTLEKHVEKEHSDGVRRCPHCAHYATTKVTFIRHYRKCHHSKSCLRCRVIKRGYDGPDARFFSNAFGGVDALQQRFEVVRPYLHHNPYSKKSNAAITPYSHCNAAMMKVAVAIPESSLMQTAEADEDVIVCHPPSSSANVREHKPRKQSTPRKLLASEQPAATVSSRDSSVCDIGGRNKDKATKKKKKKKKKKLVSAGERRRKKLLKKHRPDVKKCRLGHVEPFSFHSNVSYVRHLHWFHVSKKCACYKCGTKFKHLYQVLIHKRRHHVQS